MENQNKKGFALLMAKLETAFSEMIPKEKVALYFDYLDDLSIEQISRAIDHLIKTRERQGFPKIGEIRSATLGSMEYKAVQAWGELIGQVGRPGKNFNDNLIPEVAKIAFGSLENFYSNDSKGDMADRAYFIKAYQLTANLKEAQKERKRLMKGEITQRLGE